jgi:hypothetical protein
MIIQKIERFLFEVFFFAAKQKKEMLFVQDILFALDKDTKEELYTKPLNI